MTWATVITDASHCPETLSAGWAAWIRIDGVDQPIKRYGSFRDKIKTSTEAEALAAANGLFIARKMGATHFFLQTDCMAVVHLVRGQTKAKWLKRRWVKALEKCGVVNTLIRVRHVPGHTNTQDARSYANRWCDAMAGRARTGA